MIFYNEDLINTIIKVRKKKWIIQFLWDMSKV